jgi:hypothetical protein
MIAVFCREWREVNGREREGKLMRKERELVGQLVGGAYTAGYKQQSRRQSQNCGLRSVYQGSTASMRESFGPQR